MQLGELRRQRRGDAHNRVQENNGTEDALWISARFFEGLDLGSLIRTLTIAYATCVGKQNLPFMIARSVQSIGG